MVIDKERLIKLEKAGLLISEPFIESHITFPGGYKIAKPKSAGGNFRENYEAYWGKDILCDAPSICLYEKNSKYFIVVHEWVPGPGWGDFEKSYDNLEPAIEDIIDYYFGNPITMNPPALPPILSEDGKSCAKCGNEVLDVRANTPWEKAKAFLVGSNILDKEGLINSGFLPAGVYCRFCGKLYDHRSFGFPEKKYEICLMALGSSRQKVIVKIHQILNISLLEAKNLIDSNNEIIFTSNSFWDNKKIEFICESLTSVGAKIKLRVLAEKFGSAINPYEIEEFLDFD